MADEILENQGSYVFERNRMIHAGASEQAANEAGVRAQEASVWGADCKKDRNGNYIVQGIGQLAKPCDPQPFPGNPPL